MPPATLARFQPFRGFFEGETCMKRVFLAITMGMIPVNAIAQTPLSGMELYNSCTSKVVEVEISCLIYLVGFLDGLGVGQQFTQYGTILCPPTGITSSQLQLMLQKAAREHPELLNENANMIASKAIFDAYRCRPGEAPIYGRKAN